MVNKCYQKHQERLRKEALEKYHTEEEKDKRIKKAPERYYNFNDQEQEKRRQYYQECKQKLPKYRRNYYLTHKK